MFRGVEGLVPNSTPQDIDTEELRNGPMIQVDIIHCNDALNIRKCKDKET